MPELHGDERYTVRIAYQRGRARWIVQSYWRGHHATTRAVAYRASEAAAKAAAAAVWQLYVDGLIDAPANRPEKVGDLIDRFTERTQGRGGRMLSPKTARAYKSQLAGLPRDLPLESLQQGHIVKAIRQPPSPRSQASYLRAARVLCRWAVAEGFLRHDPTEGLHVDAGPRIIRTYLDPEEIPELLAAANAVWLPRILFVLETGIRDEEAKRARWNWIMGAVGRKVLVIPDQDADGWRPKGKRSRTIPLTAKALEALELAKNQWPEGDYILHGGTEPAAGNWTRDVHATCEKVKDLTSVGMQGLRRSAGAQWIALGASIPEVAMLLGHRDPAVTASWYAEAAPSVLVRLVNSIDKARGLPKVKRRKKRAASNAASTPDPDPKEGS